MTRQSPDFTEMTIDLEVYNLKHLTDHLAFAREEGRRQRRTCERLDMPAQPIRLGVNVDHVATVRNARGGKHP